MIATERKRLFVATPEEHALLESRYPQVFRRDPLILRTFATVAVLIVLSVLGLWSLDIEWNRVIAGLNRLGQFISVMLPPSPGSTERMFVYLEALLETLAMAFLGTLLAAILAVPFGLLAARNVVANPVVHFVTRRFLDTIRSVDKLIWALIWITVVNLGPFAGVLAIMTADFGLFGKLFSEAIEAADQKASEGIVSTGGGKLARIRFGLLPGVLPVLISQVLYQMESNARSATILGVVGAGGIGAHFQERIRLNEWQHVAFLTLIMLVAVALIDNVSARIRATIIGNRPTPV